MHSHARPRTWLLGSLPPACPLPTCAAGAWRPPCSACRTGSGRNLHISASGSCPTVSPRLRWRRMRSTRQRELLLAPPATPLARTLCSRSGPPVSGERVGAPAASSMGSTCCICCCTRSVPCAAARNCVRAGLGVGTAQGTQADVLEDLASCDGRIPRYPGIQPGCHACRTHRARRTWQACRRMCRMHQTKPAGAAAAGCRRGSCPHPCCPSMLTLSSSCCPLLSTPVAGVATEVGLFKEGGRLISFIYPAQVSGLGSSVACQYSRTAVSLLASKGALAQPSSRDWRCKGWRGLLFNMAKLLQTAARTHQPAHPIQSAEQGPGGGAAKEEDDGAGCAAAWRGALAPLALLRLLALLLLLAVLQQSWPCGPATWLHAPG